MQQIWQITSGGDRWEVLAPHKGAALAWYIRLKGMPSPEALAEIDVTLYRDPIR